VAEIVPVTIRYHLGLGLDAIWVLDNDSSDATADVLQQLAGEDPRVRWRPAPGEYEQAKLITALAREAFRSGADWVVPFDADEFWYAPCEPFREVLENSAAGALRCPVIHYIQAREQTKPAAAALLTMTRRAPHMIGPPDHGRALVEARQIAFVEMMYPPKLIARAAPDLELTAGSHSARNYQGTPITTADIVCLHAALPAREILARKVEHSARLEAAGQLPGIGWHVHRFRQMCGDGLLEAEWAANSYVAESLDVFGQNRPVIVDHTLRDAVAPFVGSGENVPATEQRPTSQRDAREWQAAIARDFLTALPDASVCRTEWACGLDEQLHAARSRSAALETQLAERTRWAQGLAVELAEARRVIADLQRTAAERTEWALRQDGEVERARAVISELQALVAERTAWAQNADAETEFARTSLAKLSGEFDEQAARVVQLQQELDALRAAPARPQGSDWRHWFTAPRRHE
jgi:hypothetical protein